MITNKKLIKNLLHFLIGLKLVDHVFLTSESL